MDVSIIGCGAIGKKRAMALGCHDRLIACCDTDQTKGEAFASQFNCRYYADYMALIRDAHVDAVVVSVVNKFTREIVVEALRKKRQVLVEKPLGRNFSEAEEILAFSKANGCVLKTGFNHVFHQAPQKAMEIFRGGGIGEIISIRARYGHGGRPGMENEWRVSKDLCGGGELLDQGVHIVDLCRWFAGDISSVFGVVRTKYWASEVEDNAFVYMQSITGVDIQFNVSWTNWRNIFSFEVFGTDGYLSIEGLGGSYGMETLEYGVRNKGGGMPKIGVYQFPGDDVSWRNEWVEFEDAIEENRQPVGSGVDGMKANQIIEAIYRSSAEGRMVWL